jgi:asparagine synthase (glutamine-hydrolysing)
MCGIFGVVDYTGTINDSIVRQCTDSMSHRGPDDSGYMVESTGDAIIGLGHRRLSIIDLSPLGHQPMHFEHLTITYNGEIYNFKDIRSELERTGYLFTSKTDTEVVLKAFHKWGIQCVSKFRGMFAFAVYDRKAKTIILVRDRVGVKPLYYFHSGSTFLFASELKPFYRYKSFSKNISAIGLSHYFNVGYIEAPYTIFENTFKVRPAHFVVYNLKDKTVNETEYWNLRTFYEKPVFSGSFDEAQETLESILTNSFMLRTIADVPVGVFLSGGIDSTLVAALIQRNSGTPINTFTIGFKLDGFDEAPFASKIAAHLGVHHKEHYCTTKDAHNIIPQLVDFYDEPFADSSAIPTYLVSQLSKEHATVVLSGDGGDELFCGYTAYDLFTKRFAFLNNPLIRFATLLLSPDISRLLPNVKLSDRLIKLGELTRKSALTDRYKSVCSIFSSWELKRLLGKTMEGYEKIPDLKSRAPAENMMLVDFIHYLPDDIMVKVDRATMAVSIEGREPLLDHTILEFAARLPLSYKHNKKILKSILAKYVPPALFERKKHGFGIPINDWIRKDLRFLIDEYCGDASLLSSGYFNLEALRRIKRNFFLGKDNTPRMWYMLVFQMWYAKYMEHA